MIEVKKKDDEKGVKELWNNGTAINTADFRIYGNSNYWVSVIDSNLSEILMKNTFNSISKDIRKLSLYYPLEFWNLIEDVIVERDYKNSNLVNFIFKLEWDFEVWKQPYSILELAQVMEQVVSDYNSIGIEWVQEDDEVVSNGCHIRCTQFDHSLTISDVFNEYVPYIREIYDKAYVLLYTRSDNSVISIFDFPEEVRVPCEQYLVYFMQFLKEIGIEATTSIQNDAGKVLFSITPISSEIALEQIRDALDIYLQLPVSLTNVQYNPLVVEPNVQQLIANVQHLNSQLLLARAITQANEITIRNQQNMISQQRELIDSAILQRSYIGSKEEKNEKILGGAFTIKKYEGNGFAVDIPEIYRRIKNTLGFKK
ncbi:hypothetical protein ABN764_24460 [Paenibacillaceae sp. P-4]|uniref:hypothetical protein n=1 Tax=Paenibacillaceae bacterium P-4 TaxID=3160969 RepID=UPI0032E8355D